MDISIQVPLICSLESSWILMLMPRPATPQNCGTTTSVIDLRSPLDVLLT